MAILQAENLTKVYGSGPTAVTALDHVNLSIEPGEFVAIMGPSGCGKSTLLHLLGGLDRPTQGRVLLDGTDLAPHERYRADASCAGRRSALSSSSST